MLPESAGVSLVGLIRPQLLLLYSVSCLPTEHSLAPRLANRRASRHCHCALTSLLRARTGLGLCLSHPAYRTVQWRGAAGFKAGRFFFLFMSVVGFRSLTVFRTVQILYLNVVAPQVDNTPSKSTA